MNDGMQIKDEVSFQVGKGFMDNERMKGHMVAELIGPDGKLKARREVHNTVTVLCHKMAADQLLPHRRWLNRGGWKLVRGLVKMRMIQPWQLILQILELSLIVKLVVLMQL